MRKTQHFLLLLALIAGFSSCFTKKAPNASTTAYNAKVSAFTAGVVSNQSAVRVHFSELVKGAEPGTNASSSVLDISPSVKGKLIWEDAQTLVLNPDKRLKSGQTYEVKLNMPAIFPGDESEFSFTFDVIKQDFRFEKVNLKPVDISNLKLNSFIGKLFLTDYEDAETVEKMVKVQQFGKSLSLTWEHTNATNEHVFTATGVVRAEIAGQIKVICDGSAAGISNKLEETIEIPSLSDFKVMEVKTVQTPSQQIIINFSDPLLPNQNLDGLIAAEGAGNIRFSIDVNVVTIYPQSRVIGEVMLNIFPGIKNSVGYSFKEKNVYQLQFETAKPSVEILGKGIILPDSKGLTLPFKAVSVRAIEVQVIKIFENNVASFLQINQLDGEEQLRRAGRLIVKKVITLDDNKSLDLTKWNTFSLDMANLVQPDPGAIYRVILKLKPEYSIYPCDNDSITNIPIEDKGITDQDIVYWDSPAQYEYSNWDNYNEDYDYDWSQRDNPCNPMYYRNRSVSRNVIASNIGLLAKAGSNKELVIAVTDLRNTQPLSDVELLVYDYQNQIIITGRSESDGLVRLKLTQKPYLIIAKQANQRGYLRVDDATALSLSRFDISGQSIKKGLKGYIYGERGVWRPGDTLFIAAIIEDKLNSLPANHPIVFELSNPQGQLVTRQVTTKNESGLYTFKVTTPTTAPTGVWLAKVIVGGVKFDQNIRIETVKPNRLKIEMDVEGGLLRKGQQTTTMLKAKWLHGAIAKNLAAKVMVTLNQSKTAFKSWPNYQFDNPTRSFSAEEITVFDGKLNDQGVASIRPDIQISEAAPGMLKASFMTRVFEEGGDFSVDRFQVAYSPFQNYVGIRTPKGDRRGMLLTDTLHTIDVATVDALGNAVSKRNLKYQIYKVQWRWWWESGEDDLARYTGSSSQNLITSGTLSTSNGKGSFKFKINYPEWGRYLILVSDTEGGHTAGTTVYVDWPGWALKPSDNPQDAAMLSFTADKDKYATGEKATLAFPSPGKGRALVSIENGSRVIKAFWVETLQGATQASFQLTDEMTPNVYAHITLVQPHDQTDNNLPIRLYGVIPILVENPETHLQPQLILPDEFQPESEATIKVKEANGKKMTYTLAVVDEGLLDLTRFKTPDPWNLFYAREALGVKTWDLYDYVMGAYGGKIEKAFSLGGDDYLNGKKGGTKANRFKPMVRYFGPFTLEKGKTQTHKIDIPRYVGSVRTMVVACNNGAYGNADVATPVRKPVMVLATLPRVLGPDEKVTLPVTVFSMSPKSATIDVTIKTEGNIELVGSKKQTITFTEAGDQVVNFELKGASLAGWAKIHIEASSGRDKATDETDLEIRNPNPRVVKTVSQVAGSLAQVELTLNYPGIEGTNKAWLEVSSIPPVDFGRRLKYLLAYPHGCVEQTTSSAFPQLYIADVTDGKALTSTIETNVRGAIAQLRSFIQPNGGFSYWPSVSPSDDWGTSYAGHFLLEAEKKGYLLPVGWKKDWVSYQKQQALKWSKSAQYPGHGMLTQAYRLYTLALSGNADMGAMNRLRNEPALTVNAKWRLAAAYALAGQANAATSLTENIGTDEPANSNTYDYTYGSSSRNKALIIETLLLLNKREQAMPLVISLSKELSSENWMSTQTTAYGLLAISQFAKNSALSKDIKFTVSHSGTKSTTYSMNKPIFLDSLKVGNQTSGTLTLKNLSTTELFVRVVMDGIPAAGEEVASSSNLKFSVEYSSLNGNAVDVSKLSQGTDFMATVRVTNPGIMGDYRNLALTQVFPSGWEIRNTRMEDIRSAYETDQPDYIDYRDDRVLSYFDLNSGKTKKFTVLLNATYKGSFYLPASTCEAMYDHSINALQLGEWVVVE